MLKKRALPVVGGVLGLVLLAAGCSSEPDVVPVGPEPVEDVSVDTPGDGDATGDNGDEASGAVDEPTEPEESVEPELSVDDFTAGDVVDEVPEDLPKGVKVYEVADGDLVVVKQDEPLPKPVKKDVQQVVDDNVPYPDGTPTIGPGVVYNAASEQAGILRGKTGRNIVVITPTITSCDPNTDAFLQWVHSPVHYLDNPTKCEQFTFKSRDNAISAVEKRISELDDPETYEIIVRKNSK